MCDDRGKEYGHRDRNNGRRTNRAFNDDDITTAAIVTSTEIPFSIS